MSKIRDSRMSYSIDTAEFEGQVRDVTAYEELWTAVIKRALEDANGGNAEERADARAWLEEAHYKELCEVLGLSGSYLLRMAGASLEEKYIDEKN